MKKLIFAIAIISTVSFASCTKENVAPTHKVTTVATAVPDKANLGNADDTTTNPPVDDKANLGNADGNPAN